MFLYAIVDTKTSYVEAITRTEAQSFAWIARFLEEYDYRLESVTRLFGNGPITVKAHVMEDPKLTVEFRISKTEEVMP